MQLKVRLQFHKSELRAKTLKMEPFSEGLFIILFYNESTFQYSPAQRKYICKFEGTQGYEQLGILFGNKDWVVKGDERIYKDSDTQLYCGSMRFEFNVDVRDFVEAYKA
ncbi:hypothetical protein RhiirC2_784008 [Rhizophagus irregularis]|uniref:Uncharacterized protein n=1 Tax=Rhizophagus irregularis TaxID=588596 RepID=A0A2N1MZQ0_9GLOM|nr:hypothetical protein RhiirC2_784008 [Rhizophagus irregularis]